MTGRGSREYFADVLHQRSLRTSNRMEQRGDAYNRYRHRERVQQKPEGQFRGAVQYPIVVRSEPDSVHKLKVAVPNCLEA